MSREEEILREACARAAREETEELNRDLTLEEMRRAEEVYRQHRPAALALIRKHAKKQRHTGRAFAAAASVVLLLGASYWALSRTTPDPVPAAQAPTASVAPYYSPTPTETPKPTEKPTDAPTETPIKTDIEIETPTETPKQTEKPTLTPTAAPTETPAPTDAPTETPSPTLLPAAYQPQGWTGAYFPQALPEGSGLAYVTQENGAHAAAYALNGKEIVFTEYDSAQSLSLDSGAESGYVLLENGLIALRTEADGIVTLIWDQDGRTLRVECEEADAEAIANSVAKVR